VIQNQIRCQSWTPLNNGMVTRLGRVVTHNRVSPSHLGIHEVPVELVQLAQPEVVAIKVRIGSIVRVASQITKILVTYGDARDERSTKSH